ncbi:MAG: Lrp/AsnC family transcriptional regulator [Candidatus Hodarchaeales archaeon]|jgi:DNA-binding Lrp family transcriptional regulator
MVKLDDLDMKILRIIQDDCRNSLQEIADLVDSSVSTVHYRIKRLENEGIIKGYFASLDAEKLDWSFPAIIQIYGKHGPSFEDLGPQISRIKGVWGVYWALGEADYFILTRAKSRNDFNSIIRRIMNIDGVERTNTHVITRIVKEDPRLNI